jgi:hypothetical protein
MTSSNNNKLQQISASMFKKENSDPSDNFENDIDFEEMDKELKLNQIQINFSVRPRPKPKKVK